MENYFKVIDGIKYDIGQATLLAKRIIFINEENIDHKRTKYIQKFLRTEETTEIVGKTKDTYYKHIYMYLGVNHTYYLYIEDITETKDLNMETKEYKNKNTEVFKNIIPITRDEAIEYWFNGYAFSQCTNDNYWPSFVTWNSVKLEPIVSEQEAFGEIPVA
jgi:hypothetical protein